MAETTSCPVCRSTQIDTLLEIRDIPLFCNVLLSSRQEAIDALTGTIRLGFCRECAHLFNLVFDPDLLAYSRAYENSLHFSPHFQAYAEGLGKKLVNKYNLQSKSAVEIGCGKGDFLSILLEQGLGRCTGFDKSFEGLSGGADDSLTVYPAYYTKAFSHIPADLVCCRHVLEHIQDPVAFLQDIRHILGTQRPVIFFEVPNMLYTLRDLGIWDLIYEHCGYFTPVSLCRAFVSAGFTVSEVYESFGGQFLCLEALTDGATLHEEPGGDRPVHAYARKFSDQYAKKIEQWEKFLLESRKKDQKLAVWGAGSKGITFLNLFKEYQQTLGCLVDINPRKQNRFAPGTGHEVVSEKALTEFAPDIVLVMNPNYTDEIRQMLDTLQVTARVLSV